MDDVELYYHCATKVWFRYRRYWGTLLEQEDAIQDAVMVCLQRAPLYDAKRAGKATYFWLICYTTMNTSRKAAMRQKRKALKTHVSLRDSAHVKDEHATPAEQAETLDDIEATRLMLTVLPLRLQAVLEMRFGFGAAGPMTLREVGRVLGCSGEYVRQLEERALAMLRLTAAAECGLLRA